MDDLDENSVQQLLKTLEEEELETMFLGKPEKYLQLFAAYLHENDLSSANFLWKRIPQNVKTENKSILDKLHNIYVAMWNNNSNEVFKLLNDTWPFFLVNIMSSIQEKKKRELFDLIGNTYTSIFETDLELITNMPTELLRENCKVLNWKAEYCDELKLIFPMRAPVCESKSLSSEDQLFALTDFVSFLEN